MQMRRGVLILGIIVDKRADHRHVLVSSEALIRDGGKTRLYLNNPQGMGLNEEGGELVSLFPRAESIEGVRTFMYALERGEDTGRDGRLAATPALAPVQGGYGLRIYQLLKVTKAAAS